MNLTPPTVLSPPRFSRHPLLWIAAAFTVGIAAGGLVQIEPILTGALAAVCSFSAYVLRERAAAFFALLGAFFFLGAFCYQFEIDSIPGHRLKRIFDDGVIASGTPVEIEGTLIGRPEPAHNGAIMRLRVKRLVQSGTEAVVSGDVRIFLPLAEREQIDDLQFLELASGDRIRTACELLREDQFLDPGVTPSRWILDRQGLDATCTVKSPLLVEITGRTIFRGPLDLAYEQRQWVIDEFRANLSPSAAGVMIASLLGDKYFLDKETAEVFRDGGTFHVLVISGLHITFIGGILLFAVGRLTRDRRWQLAVTGSALWIYTLAVGAEVPVVRASLMFTVYLFARSIYRRPPLLNTLGLCCLILLAWRPADLFDPSFQLTMVSVLSIVGLAFPLIEKLRATGSWMPDALAPFPPNVPRWLLRLCETLYWRPRVWEIDQGRQIWSARIFKEPFFDGSLAEGPRRVAAFIFEGMLVSFIVQISMLPLSIFYFHRVSPASVFLNLWVSATIAAESFAAVLSVLLGSVSDSLAAPFFALTELFNWLLVSGSAVFVHFSWASFRTAVYSGPMRSIYLLHFIPLVLLGFAAFRWDIFALVRRRGSWTVGVITCLVFASVSLSLMSFHPLSGPRPDGRLHVEFLDVGQGDAALVTFPNGETMLIDGGGRVTYSDDEEAEAFEPDMPRIGEMVVSEFLWEKGLRRVDRLVVTHADADHAQGIADVIRNFRVGELWVGALPKDGSELDEALGEAKRFAVPLLQVGRGDAFEIGGTKIETLWPVRSTDHSGSDNNASLVLRLAFGESEFLFTGDIEKETEAALLASGTPVSADVVKVPHHGSRTSSTVEFINAIRPDVAVIPVGRRSMFGHPHPEVVERWRAFAPIVLTTGRSGTISITTDGRSLEWDTFVK